ncbi:MAG: lactate utilization protein [Christensenellales bacterium]
MSAFRDLVGVLEKKGFRTQYFESVLQVRDALLAAIEPEQSVGIGGSVTIQEIGVEEPLRQRGNEVYWHWRVPDSQRGEITKKAFLADVYLMSANAISPGGMIVNIDGAGNRIGTMIGGPGKLIMVIGRNKLTRNDEKPVDRIRRVACPQNARRLELNTPCAKTDLCNDCKSPDRMCHVTVALERPPEGRDMEVWLVDQELGY